MRPLKPLTVLRRLRKLLNDKSRWTRCAMARNRDGKPVDPVAPEAVCWCLGGAYIKVDERSVKTEVWRLLSEQYAPAYVNDVLGYEAVLALLDRTIERAKGET